MIDQELGSGDVDFPDISDDVLVDDLPAEGKTSCASSPHQTLQFRCEVKTSRKTIQLPSLQSQEARVSALQHPPTVAACI